MALSEGLLQDIETMLEGEIKLVPDLDGHLWKLWKRPGRWILTPPAKDVILEVPEAAGDRVGNP